MPVKENQATLLRKLVSLFACPQLFNVEFTRHEEMTPGRGRAEVRRILVCSCVPKGYLSFPAVAQVFKIEREVRYKKSGKVHQEACFFVSSLTAKEANAAQLLSLVRGHWSIENKSHYVRDVTLGEDRSQVRGGNIAQVMAALKNACITLVRVAGYTNVAAALRYHAARPWQALKLIGVQITE